MPRKESILKNKTEAYAARIIKLYKYLTDDKRENIMSRQIYRSGTSIGANTAESKFAQSDADFLTKLTIALKEANETKYWLNRLYGGEYLTETEYKSIINEEIINILVKITGTLKQRMQK